MRIINVQDKSNGKIIAIKDFRFNPKFHKYVNNGNEEAIDLTTVIAEAEKKAFEPKEATTSGEEVVIVPAEPVVEVKIEEGVDYSSMKFTELKTLAKEKGMVIQNTTKKDELIELLKNA